MGPWVWRLCGSAEFLISQNIGLCPRSMQIYGLWAQKPIRSAVIKDVPDVIGVIRRFIPSIVVMLRRPMNPMDRSWGSCGGISNGVRDLEILGCLRGTSALRMKPPERGRENGFDAATKLGLTGKPAKPSQDIHRKSQPHRLVLTASPNAIVRHYKAPQWKQSSYDMRADNHRLRIQAELDQAMQLNGHVVAAQSGWF